MTLSTSEASAARLQVTDLMVRPSTRADGRTTGQNETIVSATAANGTTGVGVARISHDAAVATLRAVRPLLAAFDSPEQSSWALHRALESSPGGGLGLISGVDAALWDLWGKRLGVPVSVALGGRHRERVRAAVRIPATTRAVPAHARAMVIDGVPDQATMEHLRASAGDDAVLAISCGGRLSRHDAIALAVAAGEVGAWLLDPLPGSDLSGYAQLRAESDAPIYAGARSDADELRRLLAEPVVDGVVIDLSRVGGLTVARGLMWAAEDATVSILTDGATGSIGLAADLHLMSAASFDGLVIVPEDTADSWGPLAVVGTDGRVAVPDAPGLGVSADCDLNAC